MIDFSAVAKVLAETQYNGWVTITCGQPGHNGEQAKYILNELPASIELLRRAGF